MTACGIPRLLAIGSAAILLLSCQTEIVYGPYEIEGWIEQCEKRCRQQRSCDYDQFLFDHGSLSLCAGECSSSLETEANELFIAETGEVCVEALWAEVRCIFDLGCQDLESWEDQAEDAPCAQEAAARTAACDGVDAEDLLEDCGWPQSVDYWA